MAGRTPAAETRYLLSRGMELAGNGDILLQIPTGVPTRRAILSPRYEVFDQVADRSELFERSIGAEALRLVAYAIQASANDQPSTRSVR